jgi:hypothetical protein
VALIADDVVDRGRGWPPPWPSRKSCKLWKAHGDKTEPIGGCHRPYTRPPRNTENLEAYTQPRATGKQCQRPEWGSTERILHGEKMARSDMTKSLEDFKITLESGAMAAKGTVDRKKEYM